MTSKNLILLGTLLLISCSSLKVSEVDSQNAVRHYKETMLASIDKELYRLVDKCPSLISGMEKMFFRSELQYFPIESAFDNIHQQAKSLRLKATSDTIILILSYPFVGFDPQAGYTTKYYIQRKKDPSFLVRYSKDGKAFRREIVSSSEIEKKKRIYENLESGCGDGYFLISHMTPALKTIKSRVVLGLEFGSG